MPRGSVPYFVLSYDSSDREAAELAQSISDRKLRVLPSGVRGIVPELRTGVHDFVRGIRKIREFLNTEFKLEPRL